MITSQCRISAEQRAVLLTQDRAQRVYIAGPMTGIEDFNFPAFNAMADNMRAGGWHVENPADHGVVHGAEWADYLRYDVGRLATCEAIMLLPGWSKSKGANLEVTIARQLGMPIMLADGAEPAPQPHPEPIAWMVGPAFWWTKEEAERDAAATGLPIVGLGPMSGIAPVEQGQGEPMAVEGATFMGEPNFHHSIGWYREGISKHWKKICEQRVSIDALEKQLAEVQALLRIYESFPGYLIDHCEGNTIYEESLQHWLAEHIKSLPASAEPSEPVEPDEFKVVSMGSNDFIDGFQRIVHPDGTMILRDQYGEFTFYPPHAGAKSAEEKLQDPRDSKACKSFLEQLKEAIRNGKQQTAIVNIGDHISEGHELLGKGLGRIIEDQVMLEMVDAAMVEMQNISPPLKRSDCLRLIRAALEGRK